MWILKDGVREQFERDIDITIINDFRRYHDVHMMPTVPLSWEFALTPNGKIDIMGLSVRLATDDNFWKQAFRAYNPSIFIYLGLALLPIFSPFYKKRFMIYECLVSLYFALTGNHC